MPGARVPRGSYKQGFEPLPPGAGVTEDTREAGETEIWTVFTRPNTTSLIYSAPTWVRVRLIMQTAGPVAVGNKQEIQPVLSGKGIMLTQDQPIDFALGSGGRLYYAAQSIQRVAVIVEPIPWLERIMRGVAQIPKMLGALRG